MPHERPRVMRRVLLAVLWVLGARALDAQAPRPTVVVQIAGANVYLNVGADSGIVTGDTVAVRKRADAAPVGALTVVSATRTRSVLTFAGTPFPVTRGDTLFISARPRDAVTGMPAPVAMAATRPRAPPAMASGPRVDGAVALEMYGSHSETVGLGADPIRTTRDIGMPAVRFNTMVSGDRTRFRLSMRAQQRTGPTSVWDRSTRIRVYEARLERSIGAARLT
ncbi:MAG: hypothetical protein KAY61_01320, partial [Candidatus Eisenbacteria bacterium]|nr:hypothetical protein [Candidatus Eisenbacteria bacterium]